MADSVDNYSDLQELGIDVNESTDNLSLSFAKAADHLQKLVPKLDNNTLLRLYGFYKQGTEGICKAPKPNWYDLKAKSKWESWKKLGSMPQNEAKQKYIEALQAIDPSFDCTPDKKPTEQWVKVSSMSIVEDPPSELSIFDHIREGNEEEVSKYLKSNKPDIVSDGLSLIHWAADAGNLNILKKLIESGADINSLDADAQSPLHYASSCGHTSCVKFLLEQGAKKDIVDNEGNMPLDVACDYQIQDLLK